MSKSVIYFFLVLLGAAAAMESIRSTGPTEVGVLVKKTSIFGRSGVQDEVYPPGSTYFVWPFVSDWYTFDTQIRNLEMVSDSARDDRRVRDELRFKTIDGNDIGLDVIISYRLIPEKAPFILRHLAEDSDQLKNKVVRSVARSITRDLFGQLRTEQFYVAEERDKKAEEVTKALNGALHPWGVHVERVSTKDYRFNNDYQKAIEDKKVADQKTEKFKSEAQAAIEEYLRKLEQAKGQVNQMVAKADGEFARARIEADAYYAQQEKRAQATRAEGEAEAKGIAEMNKALAGAGGEVMVKLRIAEALKNKKIILLPQGTGTIDLKSTNMNALLETLGLQKAAEGAK